MQVSKTKERKFFCRQEEEVGMLGEGRLLEKVWIFLEDSPEEVNYMGLTGRV